MNEINKLLIHLFTEKNREKYCPIRVGGFLVLGVLIYYAISGIVHKTGDNFGDVCKGFAYYILAWSGAITGKSKFGADASKGENS